MAEIRIKILIILAFLLSFAGCDNLLTEPPPYVITRPVCEVTDHSPVFNYAGLSFNLLNSTQKTIEQLTVSFTLFEGKTLSNPFIGSNVFEITRMDLIPPNENREILISLDSYIYIAPAEPYLVDFFYISEIKYSDSSIWQDKNGIYSTGRIK